jgi:hypothetical protein
MRAGQELSEELPQDCRVSDPVMLNQTPPSSVAFTTLAPQAPGAAATLYRWPGLQRLTSLRRGGQRRRISPGHCGRLPDDCAARHGPGFRQPAFALSMHDSMMVVWLVNETGHAAAKHRQGLPGVRVSAGAFGRDRRCRITGGCLRN